MLLRLLGGVLARDLLNIQKRVAAGEPIAEITRYIRTKLRLSRDNPKASRLFANEILHGATAVGSYLKGPLRQLVDEKAAIIQGWIDSGRLNAVDPHHLIFAIWATTQHYADFEPQVHAVVGSTPEELSAKVKSEMARLGKAIRDALSKIDYQGVIGEIKFDRKGQANPPVYVTQWCADGKRRILYPENMKAGCGTG